MNETDNPEFPQPDRRSGYPSVTTECNFSLALHALKNGALIERPGDEGLIFMQVPSVVPLAIIPKMSSLPPNAKKVILGQNRDITYRYQLARVFPDGLITSWCPTTVDILAEDWIITTFPLDTVTATEETVGTGQPLNAPEEGPCS